MARYILDNAEPKELQRLRLVEAILDPGTIHHLEALGVGDGWRCLEVGGGGGSITCWLCGRVGQAGSVLATDLDPRHLAAIEAPNLEVRRHDILADDLPESAFDLVHIRWVLHHLSEPRRALQRLVATLRPGGWLLAEEIDSGTMIPDPRADPATTALCEHLPRSVHQLLTTRGASHAYGRQLLHDVRASGLVEIDAEGRLPLMWGGSPTAQTWILTLEETHNLLVEGGFRIPQRGGHREPHGHIEGPGLHLDRPHHCGRLGAPARRSQLREGTAGQSVLASSRPEITRTAKQRETRSGSAAGR